MPLSLKQLQDVCLHHNYDSKKCRYLAQDDVDASVYFCLKQSSKKSEVDTEVSEHLKELKQKNLDPTKQNIPLGDNCVGYPILRYIKQGYDQ
jgi:hypothetical protein